jgi:hypothetical protein
MSEMIIRLYDAATQGAKAAKALSEEGFRHVHHFSSSGGKGAKARDGLVADMVAAHVYKSHAETYANQMAKGGSLVLVHAPFGSAVNAMRILDAHNPSGKGIQSPQEPMLKWDSGAPLSSALAMPVLTNITHPFETVTGFSSLSKGKAFLSTLLGIPLLSRGLEHRTSSFGIPLLSRGKHHSNSSMGLPMLSRSPTPLSSMLGIKLLTR